MAERFSLTEEEISRLRSLVNENGFLPIREAEKMINEKEMG